MSKFRYILRYCIDPGYAEDERIAELLRFCRDGNIDEVMLFFNAEELNSGHFTDEELTVWLTMARKLQKELYAAGVGLSINPWTTTVHSPRGRVLKPGQNFTLMVGPNGRDNGVTTCPMCPEWLDYICRLWSRVATELQPSAIWIEDDWRYHNHGSVMGFGGCFCRLHLDKFSSLVGRQVTREELIANVYGAGDVHPWRAIWLHMNGQSMTDPIRKIRECVQKVSPQTRIALMCGGVDINSIEGRDWHALQQAAGFDPAFMVRPTISPYTETWAMRQYPVPARMICAALARPLEICPEMESGPRHGPYSKGCGFAGWVIKQTACFGAHAITINHYDMLGCGISIDTNFAKTLHEIKPQMNAVRRLELSDDASLGVNVLFSPRVSATLRSERPGVIPALYNYSSEWGNVAAILGFSCRFTTEIKPSEQPYAVNNQTLNAFSDDEIRELLRHSLLLDGAAAANLIDRGFGAAIGVTAWQKEQHNVAAYSYEEIPEEDATVYGLRNPRMTMQRACRTLYNFTPAAGAEICSTVRRFDHAEMFPGALFFRNGMGGRVVTLASPLGDMGDSEWFYMGYFNHFRRIFMHRLIRRCAPSMRGAFVEDMPFQCSCVEHDGGVFLAALNSTTDAADGVRFTLSGLNIAKVRQLSSAGEWRDVAAEIVREADGTQSLRINETIPVHGAVMLCCCEKK